MSFNQRMEAARRWEQLVRLDLLEDDWDVEIFGQELLTDKAREMLRMVPSQALLRWLPDMIARRGDVVVLVDAKNSFRPDTGNHAVEDASTQANSVLIRHNNIPVLYAFTHPHQCDPGQPLGMVTPKYVGLHKWNLHAKSRTFLGRGSGTPFKVAACSDICQPTVMNALKAEVSSQDVA